MVSNVGAKPRRHPAITIVGWIVSILVLIYFVHVLVRFIFFPYLKADEIDIFYELHYSLDRNPENFADRTGSSQFWAMSFSFSADRPFEFRVANTGGGTQESAHARSHRQFFGYPAFLKIKIVRSRDKYTFFDVTSKSPVEIGTLTASGLSSVNPLPFSYGPHNINRTKWRIYGSHKDEAIESQVTFIE